VGQVSASSWLINTAPLRSAILKSRHEQTLVKRIAIMLNRKHQVPTNTTNTPQTGNPVGNLIHKVVPSGVKNIQRPNGRGQIAPRYQRGARKETLQILYVVVSGQKLTAGTRRGNSTYTGLISEKNSSMILNGAGYIKGTYISAIINFSWFISVQLCTPHRLH